MGLKKGYRFKGQEVQCPSCGRWFASSQGLKGHLQFTGCGQGDAGVGLPAQDIEKMSLTGRPAPAIPDVKRLKQEVEALKLEEEKARLLATRGDRTKSPDIMEGAGLGSFMGEAQQIAQKRALGIEGQQPKNPWWSGLLGSATIADVIGILRGGVVGQPSGGGGLEGVSTLLGLIGAKDLRSLIGGNTSVATAPESFDLPDGTHIPKGFPLESNLLLAMMRQKSGDPLAAALERTLTQFGKWVDEGTIKLGSGGGGSQHIANEPSQPEVILCSKCGAETQIPPDIKLGQQIKCSRCEQTFTAVDDTKPEPKPSQPRKRQAKIKPPEKDIVVCECGQTIDVTGKEVLSEVECPACGKIGKIIKPDEPLPAITPEPPKENGSLFERSRRY